MAETPTDAKATPDASTEKPADKPVEKPAETPAGDKPAAEPEKKPEETPVAEPERKADPAQPESKAPEKYALVIPEGAAVDAADLTHLETVARASNWSNEDAQAALDEHLSTIAAQSARFLTELQADKDYGGDKLTESQQLAKRVIDRIRPDGHARREAFLRFLNRGGAGNHIEVVSFMADLGKLMSEDSPGHTRATPSGGGKDAASLLYDHPTSKALDTVSS